MRKLNENVQEIWITEGNCESLTLMGISAPTKVEHENTRYEKGAVGDQFYNKIVLSGFHKDYVIDCDNQSSWPWSFVITNKSQDIYVNMCCTCDRWIFKAWSPLYKRIKIFNQIQKIHNKKIYNSMN